MKISEFKAYLEGMGVYTADSCPAPTQDQWDLICNKIDFLKEEEIKSGPYYTI